MFTQLDLCCKPDAKKKPPLTLPVTANGGYKYRAGRACPAHQCPTCRTAYREGDGVYNPAISHP